MNLGGIKLSSNSETNELTGIIERIQWIIEREGKEKKEKNR